MSEVTDLFTVDDDGALLAVHVQPGAGRSAVVGRHGSSLKVRVAAPPVDDRANEATRELLAAELGVTSADLEITSGARSRMKRVRIKGLDSDELEARLRRVLAEASASPGPRGRRIPD